MTEADIWKWQCNMFLYASYLYYEEDVSVWTDELYDQHCHFLLLKYDKLPPWFTARVSRDDLSAGTGYAVGLTEVEQGAARDWCVRLHPTRDTPWTTRGCEHTADTFGLRVRP